MNAKKYTVVLSALLTILGVDSLIATPKAEATSIYSFECKLTEEAKKIVANTNRFNEYLESLGVPSSITVKGKKLAVNKDIATKDCLIVYGNKNDVEQLSTQYTDKATGLPKYLGFDVKGVRYPNILYPDVKGSVDFVKTRNFIKNPWSNPGLLNNLGTKPKPVSNKTSPTYVNPETGKEYTAAQELDRAVDRFWLQYCPKKNNCSTKGNRGYFKETNTKLGHTLVGSKLKDYASVQNYPTAFTVGTFDLYHKSINYWHATFFMPPHVSLFNDKRDVALKIINIQSPVAEGKQFKVTYQICNYGQSSVKNPVVMYGKKDGKNYKTTTINTTIKSGKCTNNLTLTDTAQTVDKDTTIDYELIVNKDHTNPTKEHSRGNNKDDKPLTILDDVKNGSINIVGYSPKNPHSNQDVAVKIEVCNHSHSTATNVEVSYGFNKGKIESATIPNIKGNDCVTVTHNTKAPQINKGTGKVIYTATLDKYKDDSNPSDNKDIANVTIINPDAKVTVSSVQGDSTQANDVKVKFINNMTTNITNSCGNSSETVACRTGATNIPGNARINVYDTKFTESVLDDILVGSYEEPYSEPKFNLKNGESKTITIDSDVFTNYVKGKYKDTYQLVEFRVAAEMPHFKGEVDYKGNESYENNRADEILLYYPERPNIASMKCNVLEHMDSSYFITPDGSNPIKMCAGHYPTYPSTTVESGMQAYHYVLYRFFPVPLPKYTVGTPVKDESNPNHFTQTFELPSSEGLTQLGDFESMLFSKYTVRGYYQERGRYMPTGGVFEFSVYKTDDEKEIIALGTVSYNIPKSCYDSTFLDIKHHYGCDEVLFFLPNYEDSRAQEKPMDYTNNKVVYPIKNTKIPYLNPGSYTFKFEATESFAYYYQTNERPYYETYTTSDGKTSGKWIDGYEWSAPAFK